MRWGQWVVRFVGAVLLVAGVCGVGAAGERARAGEDKKDVKGEKKRGGTVVGTLTAVDKKFNYIEVKADGEERARKYFPRWVGGNPDKGGGFDKKIVKTFRELKVGSRLRIEWEFEERPRVVRIEVLKKAEDKKE